MADFKRFKQQEIPFILDGQTIVKTITKNTTCSDVIEKLPILSCPLAVFESVDGVEKELSGKVKLLKVWRAHGPNKKVAFVIKKTSVENKGRKIASKLFSDKRNCGNHIAKSQSKRLSKETLKQVSDFASFARSQKTKVDALNKKSKGESVTSEQETLMRRMLSRASVNSVDAFLAKADLDEMARILSFCGNVTAEKLGQKVRKRETTNAASEENTETDRSNIKKHMIHYSLTSLKLGLKEKYKTKSKVTRTTSTGTISSTDTGYQSSGSEDTSASEPKPASHSDSGCISKRHRSIFCNLSGLRHSTPIIASRSQNRRADDTDRTFIEDCSVTSDKLKYLDECQGKDIVLQRFMNDQDISASSFKGCDVATRLSTKSQRRDRYSMPVFSNQEEKCRFLWDQYCDSDSDSESGTSEPCESLDIAFHTETTNQDNTASQARHRTLRRDSAISNLKRFSLDSRDIGLDMSDDGSSFDYSFDCSFPRMDESQFSLGLSHSFDHSESETDYSDQSVDSFMKTRSFIEVKD